VSLDFECEKCGMWNHKKKHDCRPEVPVTISFSLNKYTFSSISKLEFILLEQGITFDTGAGFGQRDWQFESLPPEKRLKVVEAAENSGMDFSAYCVQDA